MTKKRKIEGEGDATAPPAISYFEAENTQILADNKMRAEIAKLLAEIQYIRNKTRKIIINMIIAPLFAGAALFGASGVFYKYFFMTNP